MLKANAQPILPPALRDLGLMQYEWKGWQDVVREFNRAIPSGINDPQFNPLIKAIQLWGEKLTKLRTAQDEKVREKAFRDYEDAYNAVATAE